MKKDKTSKTSLFSNIVSSYKLYGIRTNFFKSPEKYDLPPISDTPINDGFVIWGLDGRNRVENIFLAIIQFLNAKMRIASKHKKSTQDTRADKYILVPMQNFTPENHIDWSKSIEKIISVT